MNAAGLNVTERLQPHVDRLVAAVARHGSMRVAYSGGVDSGLLAFVASRVLGDDMECVLAVSPSLASREKRAAVAFLKRHSIPWQTIETREMDDERYRRNEGDRCFFCKDELFARIASIETGRFDCISYGANADDASDHRPGARAANERGVVAPLAEAGLGKSLVREIARAFALEIWDKPAAPCLASRIPYFSRVDEEKLRQVEAAEDVLHRLGFRDCRVRHYGDTARVEVPQSDSEKIAQAGVWQQVVDGVREAGFTRVELEAAGLRSGRLNDALRRA